MNVKSTCDFLKRCALQKRTLLLCDVRQSFDGLTFITCALLLQACSHFPEPSQGPKSNTLNSQNSHSPLLAGPMPSIPRGDSVEIWLQALPEISVAIDYWIAPQASTGTVKKLRWLGRTAADGIVKADISALVPRAHYHYQLTLAGKKLATVYDFKTLVKSYFPKVHDLSFIMGSCSWWKDEHYSIMETMAEHSADFMLWLGDNLYLEPWDYDRAQGIENKYRQSRAHPSLNQLLSSKGQVATWDDHDYGRNDATKDWILKDVALEQFTRYWPNPSAGSDQLPGVHTQFRISDVDFIILDNRTYRDHPKLNQPRQMFGEDQIQWLKNNLLNSRARLKVLVTGSQWLNQENIYEGWNLYPQEQQQFLQWLEAENIPGVIFLSGDRHFTEMIEYKRDNSYNLYDLTCSPMTSLLLSKGLNDREKHNPSRVPGTLVMEHNYCQMNVDGEGSERSIHLRSFNAQGKELWYKQILYSDLGL